VPATQNNVTKSAKMRAGPTIRKLIARPFSELIISAAIGLIIFGIDRSASESLLTLTFGLVLSVSRQAFSATISRKLIPLSRLTEWLDINRRAKLPKFHDIIQIYMEILEPDFLWLKEMIIAETAAHLQQLATQKRSRELATGEYYRWLYSMLEQERQGGEIWAVSTMNTLEWDQSATEQKFVEQNKAAVERGVALRRAFIVRRADESKLQSNPSVAWQLEKTRGLEAHIVIREELERNDAVLLRQIGDGFIAFNRRAAMIDVFSNDGSARGYVSMNEQEIATLRFRFEQLLTHGSLCQRP
jgi:hypothetical protein